MRNPDFVKLAQSMGWSAIRVNRRDELEEAMTAFLNETEPVLLDVQVDKREHVRTLQH